MHDWKHIHEALDQEGILGCPVQEDVYAHLNQTWLRTFCPNVMVATGYAVYEGYRWHAYTYGFERASEGKEAVELYNSKRQESYFIHFESEGYIFDCVGGPSPDLSEFGDDIYVFPSDMSWTMIFTHEKSIGIGPFFAMKQYEAEQAVTSKSDERLELSE